MVNIENNISEINSQIPAGVTLVAVSKFHPIDALQVAYNAGVRDFGESRVQELMQKVPEMPSDVIWHFIGHLQTNKVKALLPYVSLIHSVDSLNLLKVINAEAKKISKTVDVLLQLHVAKEETKYGFDIEDCVNLLRSEDFASMSNVRIKGVMGMATNTDDEDEIRKEFAQIKSTFDRIKSEFYPNDKSFTIISMGMSDDYRIAISEGSNMVRIGSSIFGLREY